MCGIAVEVVMNLNWRSIVRGLLIVLGIVLLVGGIVAAKHGATVVGICVLGATAGQRYLSRRKARPEEGVKRTI
jgi:hypothetical protein